MTLGELIQYLEGHPYYLVFYFVAIPLAAFLSNILSKGESHLNPWCMFYAALIYMSVIPGVFAVLLNLYHILFEKSSIYNLNILIQILPILSMFLSLILIKRNIDFDKIPGFGKMTRFVGSMAGIMVLFFLLDKARLIAFTYIPIFLLILILIGIYMLFRHGSKFFLKK